MTYEYDIRLSEKEAAVFISALELVVAHCEEIIEEDRSYLFPKESAEAVLKSGKWETEAPSPPVWKIYLAWFTASDWEIESAFLFVIRDCKIKVDKGEYDPYQFRHNLASQGLNILKNALGVAIQRMTYTWDKKMGFYEI